ncbi:MAG TPA: flagellar protein FliT [Burkholderiaceae bacterium]|jgi:flagellar protein FliT|nr:flagellar protein FliT [Burkholderiaceae bacterium]
MMNSQEVVSLYETIAEITDQMLSAARTGNWQQLSALEKICAQHVETIKCNEREVAQGVVRERKVKIIQKILADDREIRNITEPWMAKLSMQINSANAKRKLAKAYGANRSS